MSIHVIARRGSRVVYRGELSRIGTLLRPDDALRFFSVCSGIEAASVAWKPLGWKHIGFAEIEKFPSAVLAHHYPGVPNHGDFTKVKTRTLGRVDILCGGTPCQAFSVAGRARRSPCGRGLSKQFAEQLEASLSQLSLEGASPCKILFCLWRSSEGIGILQQALSAIQRRATVATTSAVRRLTPRECERLQGFQFLVHSTYPGAWQDEAGRWWSPDYTAIPWRGKPAAFCPDGPRYKSLGNSWAVPKFYWLGARIAALMPLPVIASPPLAPPPY